MRQGDLRVMQAAAERYAAAEKSDPFAYNRAMSHLKNGVATYADKNGAAGYYDAEEATETRHLPTPHGGIGAAYTATVYRNVSRP